MLSIDKQQHIGMFNHSRNANNIFDAVLFIDCWGENWIHSAPCLNCREFYGRIVDFIKPLNIPKVLYSTGHSDIHPIFKESFKTIQKVETVEDLSKQLQCEDTAVDTDQVKEMISNKSKLSYFGQSRSNILVSGQAFNGCFHHNDLGVVNLLLNFFGVFSAPFLANNFHTSDKDITEEDFNNPSFDPVRWVPQRMKGIYRALLIDNGSPNSQKIFGKTNKI